MKRPAATRRRGAAAVEFAVVVPLVLLLVLGIIEFGRMVMVQQVLTNAAREGARRAILEHATDVDVEKVVTDYLARTSVAGVAPQVSPAQLDRVGFGDPVAVSVSVPYRQVSWLPAPRFLGNVTLVGQSVMRAERPE